MPVPRTAHSSVDVLVVDDDAATVLLVQRIVERMGHRCRTAHSGEEALDRLRDENFSLVVTDISMSGVSGLDVLRFARERDADIAVIIASGVDDPRTADDALNSGAFGYVVKPFEVVELQIAVSNSLRRRDLEIELRNHLRGLEAEVDRRTEQLRLTTHQAQVQEQQFRSLVAASPLGVVYADLDGGFEYCNSNAESLLGRDPVALADRQWLDGLDSTGRTALTKLVGDAATGVTGSPCEYELRRPDGSVAWLRSRVAPVVDDTGDCSGVVVLFEDIADRKSLEQELRHQAGHDHLTGLPNRRGFRAELTTRLEALDDGDVLAVLMVDLDQFKLVNDTYGHEAGDQLIAEVGRRLTECAPAESVVARLGGDEFVVALSIADRGSVLSIGDAFRESLRQPVSISGIELALSSSVGVGITSNRSMSVSDLLRRADIALHHAKISRDAIEVFDSSMADGVSRRLTLTSDLRQAIDATSLSVHYQPVFDVGAGRLAGFEALARWTHPSWGPIGPDEFIPIAESIGIVHRIDLHVLTTAVEQLAKWKRTGRIGPDVFMSVNISASQLSNSDLPNQVQAALSAASVDGSSLMVEVTEGSIIQDLKRAAPTMHRLRALGIRIAIDDFGTGHSALSYLDQLPLDVLKIDRSFIATIDSGGVDMVDIIIDLAHRFGLDVIAEGIEEQHQLNKLTSARCEMAQGYLLGRPADVGHVTFEPPTLVPIEHPRRTHPPSVAQPDQRDVINV